MNLHFLNEGGAAGHMNHLYDNGNLTFAKIKEIFTAAANGQLVGTEKTDGQNLMISFSVKEGRAKGVRNKGEIKSGGLTPEQLAAKFADRANPALKETFSDALRIFEKAVQHLGHEVQVELFGEDTSIYYNAEVMDPRTPNVINYDTKTLVIHRAGHTKYDRETGQKVDIDLSKQSAKLEEIIKSAQENLKQEEYGIQVNAIKKLQALSDKKPLTDALDKLNKVMSAINYSGKEKINDSSTIDEYMMARVRLLINNILNKEITTIGEVNSLAKMNIAKKIVGIDGISIKEITNNLSPLQKEFIKNNILKKENIQQILKTAIVPVESIVSDFATEMLRDLKSAFILDNTKEVTRLRAETQEAIDAIKSSGNAEAMNILQRQIKKLRSAENISATAEGFVFDYDGVTYKFTGNFAPMNQLLGLFKYGRGSVPPLKKEKTITEAISKKEVKYKDIICIYPGRFQPMGKHHVEVFKALQEKFGSDDVYIATSDVPKKPDPVKSPLNFEEKKSVMLMHDIPRKQIIKCVNPYKAEEIVSKFNPKDTVVVFAVGEKDMKDDPRFKITDKSYFKFFDKTEQKDLKGYLENGYLTVAPHTEFVVKAQNDAGKKVSLNISSGTQIREILASGDKSLFKEIMGFWNEPLYNMLVQKFVTAANYVKPPAKKVGKKKEVKESLIDDIINNMLNERIVKRGSKFCLISKKSDRNLGCYRSKSGAEKREKQVQYFKHMKEEVGSVAVQGYSAPIGRPIKREEEEN